MKKRFMPFLITGIFLLSNHSIISQNSTSEKDLTPFQGDISFNKTVGSLNLNYKYYVKDNMVRIEEINKKGMVDAIKIVNLDNKKVIALSPERKLYLEAPLRSPAGNIKVDVNKTGNSKTILGKSCEEIIVTNKEQDRKIVYWVTKGNYGFFIPMLEALNRKEKQAMYYLKIKGLSNYFPMKSTEYILSSGNMVSELVTQIITAENKEESLFSIPTDYTKFEH
jgi:hypothetical protein